MSAKKKAIKELLRAKNMYITPILDKVRTIHLRSYISPKKPSSRLMHEAGILDASGLKMARDAIKKKLAQTEAGLKGLAFSFGGKTRSAAQYKDALKRLKKAKSKDLASKYKYKNIKLKNKIMAKSMFVIPAALVADRLYTDGHGTAKDED